MNSTTLCFCSLVKSCLCVTLLVTRDMWPPRFIGSAAWKRNHHYSGISQQQINTQRQLYNDKIISSLILKIKCPDAGFITSSPQTRSLVLVEKNAMDPWPPLRLGWGCLVCGKLTKSAPESSVEKTRPIFAKKKKISLHFCRARCLQGTESNWRVWIFLRVWSWLRSVSRKRNALRARHSQSHGPVSCRMSEHWMRLLWPDDISRSEQDSVLSEGPSLTDWHEIFNQLCDMNAIQWRPGTRIRSFVLW